MAELWTRRAGAVGSSSALPGAADALRVDAGGRLVTPGLIDAHTHLVPAARAALLVDVRAAESPERAAETVAAAHATLAMLHDLGALDAQGVAVDADLAARAVGEAEHWVERLCAPPQGARASNGGHASAMEAPA